MPGSITIIQQQLYRASIPPITLELVEFASLTTESISDLITTLGDRNRLGISASYGKKSVLRSLALSTETRVLMVVMDGNSRLAVRKKEMLGQELLCNSSLEKHGFFMERIAAALYLDVGLFISNAFDVTASVGERGSRIAYEDVLKRTGIDHPLNESVVRKTYVEQRFDRSQRDLLALRAWTCCVGAKGLPRTLETSIDTSVRDIEELNWMCKCVRDADRLDSMSPSTMRNDVDDIVVTEDFIHLKSTRYKTRILVSETQYIRFVTDRGYMKGRVRGVRGKAAIIAADSEFNQAATIRCVITIGKGPPTAAKMTRADLVLDAFEDGDSLLSSPFVRKLFFPGYPLGTLEWPKLPTAVPAIRLTHIRLNDAQEKAVEKCLSNEEEDRHVVIIGPPGTGKTTIIAAAVRNKVAEHPSNTVWVVAQSNVAIKNVAEKLIESRFLDFKLLVSAGFHLGWHEHLYEELLEKIIESREFRNPIGGKLEGARVILCTINLMAGQTFDKSGLTRLVPVQTVIVDEASQIEVGDYFLVLAKYKSTLRKMVFIGDDKQLPPYGKGDIPELRSVFEWQHLRDNAVFLDVQYRMPTVIGNFISRHVYSSMLSTHHKIVAPTCCHFVDVRDGREVRTGHSWTNPEEINCAVRVARRYLREKRKFKIITPYDAQRHAIENALKDCGIVWENTVFNVDSFQGNEEDHIVLSIVRTTSPGFMTNQRRTNVMLSRCKESMLILTHRGFMQREAAWTLVGRFAEEHTRRVRWMTMEELGNHRW